MDANPTSLLNHGNEVIRIWHERIVHINFKYLQKLQKKSMVEGLANHHAKAYEFSHFVVDANPVALVNHVNEVSRMWHERFGHLNFKYLQQLQKNSMV